ncbi:MAG: extracellular solute-binding protein [Candidatus Altiarchaeota archaeon]|nr:extracellular solute-binding protein [Candidatus Altiarchaeota archaeon]
MQSPGEVVVYVAHDQDLSEPILKDFEAETGIKVKPLYDTETTKTVGLVNKLIAEKNNPQADVFWNNEVSRTMKLKDEGILAKYVSPNSLDKPANMRDAEGFWTGFGARARVILYNTDLVSAEDAPKSILDFTQPFWNGKFCIANPLFGSTGSHVSAIFALWGEDKAKKYFQDLKDNSMAIVESNGMVRDAVVAGEYLAGITDTDDAYEAISEGKHVAMVFPDADDFGTLFFPNSVMLVNGGPNPENGKKFIDYVLSAKVESKLAGSQAMQIPLGKGVPKPDYVPDIEKVNSMQVTQEDISQNLESSQRYVQETLLT